MSNDLDCFAVCLPGLEPMLRDELHALDIQDVDVDAGGVVFHTDKRGVYRANLELGLASQVLVRKAQFGARSLGELVRKVARVAWDDLLEPGQPVRVKATCKRSRLYHSGAVEERVLRGIGEQLDAQMPEVSPKDRGLLLVRARLIKDQLTLSVDTSGEPLNLRGWRKHTGKAPLRADLARALVLASGWDQNSTLFDPMMGSGPIVIEAAGLARGLAAGRMRSFAFEQAKNFDAALWQEIKAAAEARSRPELTFKIRGSDRDPRSVASATANAENAGVLADLELCQRPLMDVPELDTKGAGAMVTNPPYGHRLGDSDSLRNLYQSLGKLVRSLPDTWRFALLAMDRRLALKTGLELKTAFLADNGGLKVRAMVRTMPQAPD
jgi:putative N6-adenine-specific DNA methylase